MKAFLDTSVLVAAFYGEHEHHSRSIGLLAKQKPQSGCTAAHCLADVYAVLTGMPGKDRARPAEALLFLADVRTRLGIVAASPEDYGHVIDDAAAMGITGGGIYDALIARCGIKSQAEFIYTWNPRNFTRLGPDVSKRIRTP